MFTIQHHFGSKLALYRAILERGDLEVRELLERIVAAEPDPRRLVERVVDELFDFFLRNRDWVALNARASLGEKLPHRGAAHDRGWVDFMGRTMRSRGLGAPGLDLRLLLITVEGILNNHALAEGRHRRLFGRTVGDPRLAAATKAHLKRTILAILDRGGRP
jgi:AcrR family transcriptional regulator